MPGSDPASSLISNGQSTEAMDACPRPASKVRGTAWARSGTPIDVVQKLLGHQNPLSTAKYLHPCDAQMRMAVDTVERARAEKHAKVSK